MKTNVPESVPSVPKVSGAASLMATCTRRYGPADRKSTRLNSSHLENSYAVFCLKKNCVRDHRTPIGVRDGKDWSGDLVDQSGDVRAVALQTAQRVSGGDHLDALCLQALDHTVPT